MTRDVIVIGGGPAGSTAANLFAQAGHDVLLLEKETFPRFHIGESLLPIDLPIFARLGVELAPQNFLRKDGAEFIDERTGQSATFLFSEGLPGTPAHAFQVERSAFDHVLLLTARARGAEVREGVRVADITVGPDAVAVSAKTDAGTDEVHRARFLIDATGQDALLARTNRTAQPYQGFGRVAVFRHYHGLEAEIADELARTGNIKVLMVPEGWMWLIPLSGARLSVGIVSRGAVGSGEVLEEAIARSPLIQRLTSGATPTAPRIIRNFSFRNTRAHGPRWACAGDAACFLDPVFSSGVSLAMLGAESVVDTVSPALREGREGAAELLDAHAAHMQTGYRSFSGLIRRFYDNAIVRSLFFAETQNEVYRTGITSVLGGDLWRADNTFQTLLLRYEIAAEAGGGHRPATAS
ncbi:MAG: NAD(P)/FAD-dependent oxidoreductase [Polyangia bacterium]